MQFLVISLVPFSLGIQHYATADSFSSIWTALEMTSNEEGSSLFQPKKHTELCLTKGCVTMASRILRDLNTSTDPCDNFYEFACGSFKLHNTIPIHSKSWKVFIEARESNYRKAQRLLEEPIKRDAHPSHKTLKRFYANCVADDQSVAAETEVFMDFVSSFEGSPLFEPDWSDKYYSWEEQLGKLSHTTSIQPIIRSFIQKDPYRAGRYTITIDRPRIGSDDHLEEKIRGTELAESYFSFMKESLKRMGISGPQVGEQLREILRLELAITQCCTVRPQEARYPQTLGELMDSMPETQWDRYFFYLLQNSSSNIWERTKINVQDLLYVSGIGKIIKKFPRRTTANYLMWHYLRGSLKYLGSWFREPMERLQREITVPEQQNTRAEICYNQVQELMGPTLIRMFIKAYLPDSSIEMVEEVTRNIVDTAESELHNLRWMDQVTTHTALNKLRNLEAHIAVQSDLIEGFVELETENNHFIVAQNLASWKMLKEFDAPEKSGVRNAHYALDPLDSPIAHIRTNNAISLGAGALQPPLFYPDVPDYLNFAGIGQQISRQLILGFNTQGRHWDKEGVYHRWSTPKTEQNFQTASACVREQLSNLTGQKIQQQDLTEIFATELGTMRYTKKSYERWQWNKQDFKERILPGLQKYTREQLYFIAYANSHCSLQHRAKSKRKNNNPTDTGPRINLLFGNFEDFTEAFNCPKRSKMNPKSRCRIW